MSQMWTRLNVYTIGANGEERPVNHNNEWGGYSRYLKSPVITGWRDRTTYDKSEKTTTTTVRLKVEQIQLVSDVGQVDLWCIGLQGA